MVDRVLHFGAMIQGVGHGLGEWRHPDAQLNASTSFEYYTRQSLLAESAKFDFVFIADTLHIDGKSSPHSLNRFEPVTLLSSLAAVTKHIGLAATLTTSYTEPFHVARQLASLDHLSQGRAAWNVVTSWIPGTALNFNKLEHFAHDERYRRAEEHLQVVKGLWDSWEDDAFVHDRDSGQFFDPQKLHTLNHKGEFFQVQGPLNIARSAQGHPVIFQAGTSDAGRDFAARYADAVFVAAEDLEESQAYYRDMKKRVAEHGRDPSKFLILPGIRPIVGKDKAEADQRLAEARELVSLPDALKALSSLFEGYDFTALPLDAPFPELGDLGSRGRKGASESIKQLAKSQKLSVRDVALRVLSPNPNFVGESEKVARTMVEWFDNEAADGFIINNVLPHGLQHFTSTVIPLLQKWGVAKTEYPGNTLRSSLGLDKPVNRYSA